ncbi:MAG: phosphatidate cytidylyltransferase [Candidatus Delongbacteria bacterium]|jgi:phosphatidate cytidylyltransferase|nr:phosphatidate cytidylyltransferase [Candidatus Delongbacteria bacterium]
MNKNMVVRSIVALIAAPVILYLPFLGNQYFTLFIFVISFLGTKELVSFYEKKGIHLNKTTTFLVSLVPITVLFYDLNTGIEVAFILVLLLFLLELFRNKENPTQIVSGYALAFIYLGIFPAALLATMKMTEPIIFIYIYSVIMATDIFAYFGGMTCSKMFKTHPLAKKISPKKTIEGSISGIVFAMAAGILIYKYTPMYEMRNLDLNNVLILSFIISIVGQLGDLFESMLKRDCGVKDSSNIIPGHGGILDRFDSVIFISPIVYIYFKYFIL